MKRLHIFALAGLLFITAGSTARDLAKYVNPFIGASTSMDAGGSFHGLGKTFPGAATPFGMTQVSPNTITGGDNGPGYSYEHQTIEGFALTQMSGIGWYGDLGNFLVMPATGDLKLIAGREKNGTLDGYRSKMDKESEQAKAGYYSVKLTDYDILAECSATPRCGIMRFTFPEHNKSRIQIDLARRVGGTSTRQYIEVVNKNTIRGWMECTPEGGGWGDGAGDPNYTVYFYARFSRPLADYGFWSADIPDDWSRKRNDVTSEKYQERISGSEIIKGRKHLEGKHIGFFTEFPTREGETVELKTGISFVDMEGARKNFEAEIAKHDFDAVAVQAYRRWNDALKVIDVETGDEEAKHIFYTSLYHTMIDPRNINDVDGRYYGGDKKIHRAGNFQKRTIFSGWDVFRSQFPLQTIINPDMVSDMLNSLITLAEESGRGYFERWEFINAYSGCMLGNPAISVLADAYFKGIRDYDIRKAYKYAVSTSEKFGPGDQGYVPGSISATLEYAYSDWCLGMLAKELGHSGDAKKYLGRSNNYRNIYDRKEMNWFRPRRKDGSWAAIPPKGRYAQDYGCVESNPYQQGWFVPHDMNGMVELMGGREAVRRDLEIMFDHTPADMKWNDYYNHPNEPVHHIPFIFNRIGYPWLTQKWTRHICANAYRNGVEGLVGNEDVGQMSAWYVLAAIGIHPICPGETRYEITSPVFDKVTINLPNGKVFQIIAEGNSPENIFINGSTLNGQVLEESYIYHDEIINGGKLRHKMSARPKF